MKVLHITNWHPNKENPFEAIWMRRHVEALSKYCENEVWHIQVRANKPFKWHSYTDNDGCYHRILDLPTSRSILIELFTSLILWWLLVFKIKKKEFDILNFHIAYPLLTFWKWIRPFVKIPVIITEHWSAYHRNFGMPPNTTKLHRVKQIFHLGIPVITVSQALGEDIVRFSGNQNLVRYVIPNVIDATVFNCTNTQPPEKPVFFMMSGWAYPKTPHIPIEAFNRWLAQNNDGQLLIGGYGMLLDDMKNLVQKLKIENHVRFLGKLEADEIAKVQNQSTAFLHCSDYETFSVVCAEAICCGTPVIASNTGGIPEFINQENGLLVVEDSVEAWAKTLEFFCTQANSYNKKQIAINAANLLDLSVVGEKYYEILNLFKTK